MNTNDEIQNSNFSDIPALGDTQGLETYLTNATLSQQGLTPANTPAQTYETQPNVNVTEQNPGTGNTQPQPQPQPQPSATTGTNGANTVTLTKEQFDALLARRTPTPSTTPQQTGAAIRGVGYTAQEQQFIANALAKGYTLAQINQVLESRNGKRIDPALEQRLTGIESYLRTQEYKAAETEFITKLSNFGDKWGLSEQDLVLFGNKALEQGINIATANVNLETVFRAIFPEQYAIRSQRMSATSKSQFYGGTSIPESTRISNSKAEDAWVDSFLKSAMPNQYAASKNNK